MKKNIFLAFVFSAISFAALAQDIYVRNNTGEAIDCLINGNKRITLPNQQRKLIGSFSTLQYTSSGVLSLKVTMFGFPGEVNFTPLIDKLSQQISQNPGKAALITINLPLSSTNATTQWIGKDKTLR